MDGGADLAQLPRFRLKGGAYYHIFRGTWRRLAPESDPAGALERYDLLEDIVAEAERRLDATAGEWYEQTCARQGRRHRRGPRPYPPRMHEKGGLLYHVFRNKWRRIGAAADPEAAYERYRALEREFVEPSRRERRRPMVRPAREQARPDEPTPAPAAEPPRPQAPAPANQPASCNVVPFPGPWRPRRWSGYYGGGTPQRGAT